MEYEPQPAFSTVKFGADTGSLEKNRINLTVPAKPLRQLDRLLAMRTDQGMRAALLIRFDCPGRTVSAMKSEIFDHETRTSESRG